MNQIRAPRIRVGRRRYLVPYQWLAATFILTGVSGWYALELFATDPSTPGRVVGSILLPFAFIFALVVKELGGLLIGSRYSDESQKRLLYPFGSVAAGFELPAGPGVELRREFASVIPALAVAMIFAIGAALAPSESFARNILIIFSGINLLVGLVNLLPAMPFAGGSAFRAIFWHLHGSHRSGTRAVFLYGQFVASASLAFGIYFLTWRTSALIPGIWCVFAGWLIIVASRSELLRANIMARADSVCAADAVAGLNPTVRAAAPLTEAIDILMEQKTNGPGLVRDRNEYAGMINLDIVRAISRSEWIEHTAIDATVEFKSLTESEPGADLLSVLRLLSDQEDSTIIVRYENGRISGLIDQTMDPRMLLRRGLMRKIDSATSMSSSREGPTSS